MAQRSEASFRLQDSLQSVGPGPLPVAAGGGGAGSRGGFGGRAGAGEPGRFRRAWVADPLRGRHAAKKVKRPRRGVRHPSPEKPPRPPAPARPEKPPRPRPRPARRNRERPRPHRLQCVLETECGFGTLSHRQPARPGAFRDIRHRPTPLTVMECSSSRPPPDAVGRNRLTASTFSPPTPTDAVGHNETPQDAARRRWP